MLLYKTLGYYQPNRESSKKKREKDKYRVQMEKKNKQKTIKKCTGVNIVVKSTPVTAIRCLQ